MRSPQTIGLEWARPGIGVFQATFVDDATSHDAGGVPPSATPLASGPRNDGQFCACAGEAGATRDGERDERGRKRAAGGDRRTVTSLRGGRCPQSLASANSWLRLTMKSVPLAGTGVE